MFATRFRSSASLAAVLVLLLTGSAPGQSPAKRPIAHDAYDGWRSIQDTSLTDDGRWLAYGLSPQDGDGELVVRQLDTGTERRQPRGRDPLFTADGRFVVFRIAPPDAETDKAKKDKKKPEDQPKPGLGVMTLADGKVWTAERVKSVKVPKDASTVVAYLLEPEKKAAEKKEDEKKPEPKAEPASESKPEPKAETTGGDAKKPKKKEKEPGTTLVLRSPDGGNDARIEHVSDYALSDDGAWLVYAVSTKDTKADGLFARRLSDASTRPLLAGPGHYKQIAIDDASRQVAFVSDRDAFTANPQTYKLYYWPTGGGATGGGAASGAVEIASKATASMPKNFSVSDNGAVQFSKDGTRLFFGTVAIPAPEPDDDVEPLKVDIWHWKDPELQTMQKARVEDERKRSYRAVYHVRNKRVVQLATLDMPDLRLAADQGATALGVSDVAYRPLVSWDGRYEDATVIDLATGAGRKIGTKLRFGASISPGGRYILYFDHQDGSWYSIRTSDGKQYNLTDPLRVSFTEEDWDTPDTPAPYGIAGWTEGDRSVLLYDRFDIWEIKPDGTDARTITGDVGRSRQIRFRYVKLDDEETAIPANAPLLLSAVDQTTKASGFYRLDRRGGAPQPLLMVDKFAGTPIKAKKADRMVLTFSRFEEFPDLWLTDSELRQPKKISDANPQQQQFVWGRSELISYRNADGKVLQAILTKPEDFDPNKKYPLMVYIYEQLSQGLHRYVPPSPGTSINVTRYVSNGYLVLQPDIIYDTGYPGESALKCVLPAVQEMIGKGYVDPQRVGIQGHSWGGYQIAYLITRTDIFRAVEAGAPVSNMISAYGGIRWGTGMSRAFQYEKTQSRIGAPPWERPLQFIENSPLFWVEKVNTPYLSLHNDDDDAVPWYQSIEFFSALRRLGKEAYFFNYNGEKHGLRERDTQKHWTVHMAEFFDHYLKGAPRPDWMEHGVPYRDRGKRDLTPFYGKMTDKP